MYLINKETGSYARNTRMFVMNVSLGQ